MPTYSFDKFTLRSFVSITDTTPQNYDWIPSLSSLGILKSKGSTTTTFIINTKELDNIINLLKEKGYEHKQHQKKQSYPPSYQENFPPLGS